MYASGESSRAPTRPSSAAPATPQREARRSLGAGAARERADVSEARGAQVDEVGIAVEHALRRKAVAAELATAGGGVVAAVDDHVGDLQQVPQPLAPLLGAQVDLQHALPLVGLGVDRLRGARPPRAHHLHHRRAVVGEGARRHRRGDRVVRELDHYHVGERPRGARRERRRRAPPADDRDARGDGREADGRQRRDGLAVRRLAPLARRARLRGAEARPLRRAFERVGRRVRADGAADGVGAALAAEKLEEPRRLQRRRRAVDEDGAAVGARIEPPLRRRVARRHQRGVEAAAAIPPRRRRDAAVDVRRRRERRARLPHAHRLRAPRVAQLVEVGRRERRRAERRRRRVRHRQVRRQRVAVRLELERRAEAGAPHLEEPRRRRVLRELRERARRRAEVEEARVAVRLVRRAHLRVLGEQREPQSKPRAEEREEAAVREEPHLCAIFRVTQGSRLHERRAEREERRRQCCASAAALRRRRR